MLASMLGGVWVWVFCSEPPAMRTMRRQCCKMASQGVSFLISLETCLARSAKEMPLSTAAAAGSGCNQVFPVYVRIEFVYHSCCVLIALVAAPRAGASPRPGTRPIPRRTASGSTPGFPAKMPPTGRRVVCQLELLPQQTPYFSVTRQSPLPCQ